MATALTDIFGSEIRVIAMPDSHDRQFAAYPGANGLMSLYQGTRGMRIIVTGILWFAGDDYNTARTGLESMIDDINAYVGDAAADYSYRGTTYYNVVFAKALELPEGRYYWNGSKILVKFKQELMGL